ncbi:AzlC family ABC transporter permease [Alphaproteobacteria bacterium]|jgi:predicted branched-subunit amino acid permease|nr:AzlC family ABC transporter permease [Alphaproteobacteria bacterium]MDA9054682.1 AzlC family ABC transporter permease [Alphaproteobacteria bacterium]MDG2490443.1 AzlC family ABC transporter permease [Alphaproteobacteria bacterium]HBV78630.1 branched-chain amino acid ABC transporter permease [Alphaproteobacteria bacterium]
MPKAQNSPRAKRQNLSAKSEFWSGVRDEVPLIFGVAPFGLVFGVLGIESGLTPLQTIMLSSILFGGASQIVFVQLWAAGVPALIVGGSVCVINVRHVLYSASVAAYLRPLPLRWRILLGYLLTDEAYAISIKRFRHEPPGPNQHFHLLGSGMLLWTSWQFATIFGVLVGGTIPESWSLSFAIPLTFIAVVAPILKTRADLAAVITAASISIIGQPLPWNSWLIIAAIGGILAGWLVSRLNRQAGVAS